MGFDGRDTPTLTFSVYSSPSFNITRYFSLFMKISSIMLKDGMNIGIKGSTHKNNH